MAINIWTKPAEFKYVELPFEAIAAALAGIKKKYMILLINMVMTLEQHCPR